MKRRTKKRTARRRVAAVAKKAVRRRTGRTTTMRRRRSTGGSSSGRIDLVDIALAFASGGAAVLAVGAASRLLKPHLGNFGDYSGALSAVGVGVLAQKFLKDPLYRNAAIGAAGVSVVASIAAKFVPQLVDYIDAAVNPDTMLAGDTYSPLAGEILLTDTGPLFTQSGILPEPMVTEAYPLSGSNSSPLG